MDKGSEGFEFYIDSAGRTIQRQPDVPESEYPDDGSYHILSDVNQRRQLASDMAAFVHARVTEQYESMSDYNNQTLVFLDKSARPAAWFFRYMWHNLYSTYPAPDIKYVNIGQEKGPEHEEFLVDFSSLKDTEAFYNKTKGNTKMVNDLKKVFQKKEGSEETYLDNRDVLIVDEHSNTGNTLVVAKALFDGAFGSRIKSLRATDIFSQEPPWLFDEDMIGVTDRKPGDFTTKGIKPVPQDTHQLRKELKMLSNEYTT